MCPPAPWGMYRPSTPSGYTPDVIVLALLVALSAALTWPSPVVELDITARDFFYENRTETLTFAASILVKLGQGGFLGFVALFAAASLARKHFTIRPMVAFMSTLLLVGTVMVLKFATGRIAPEWTHDDSGVPPFALFDQVLLFSDLERTMSYPSGHLVNAVVWYGLLVLLLGELMRPWMRYALIIVPPIAVFTSMIYLGWHWVSDCVAGLLIGIVILRLVKRTPWETIPLPTYIEPRV
ncbi:phosphatase PAP2 family protein [Natronoglycomyces albus]|uniref:Phosphatase PAP2 family protein n=1 Tax=Natronoglycomyces albus TaxID=2811108 RepID=A0A895XQ50_9ACTN|nr:phosphatase PAP2 family protein [Natronoglycomyces albus]QSB05499.1 phosphatase PAP2 family protein [Natronoglycomyces albus]